MSIHSQKSCRQSRQSAWPNQARNGPVPNPVDKTAFGLAAKIKLDEKNEDTNKGQGYFFPLYNPSGQILPGYKAGLALAYTSWGQLIGVEMI